MSQRETLSVPDRAAWRAWLEEHHADSPGVWLVLQKKASRMPGVRYEEAVEEALAFGWIDSTTNRLDEHSVTQLFTPRKPGSTWAASNKDRVARLTAAGQMQPAGLAAVRRAQEDGTWDALTSVEALLLPEDFSVELAADAEAQRTWDGFADSSKKMILWWIVSAKRPETRARRIRHAVEMASKGLRARIDE